VTNIPLDREVFLLEVDARATVAHHVINGFALAIPALSDLWQQIDNSISDTATLITEIRDQYAALTMCRLNRANIAAAGLATLTAWHDGEADPLAYLRDELTAQGFDRSRA
jgi:hypothetical protein